MWGEKMDRKRILLEQARKCTLETKSSKLNEFQNVLLNLNELSCGRVDVTWKDEMDVKWKDEVEQKEKLEKFVLEWRSMAEYGSLSNEVVQSEIEKLANGDYDSLECYVMEKLYDFVFVPNRKDKELKDKIARHQFITMEHLEIKVLGIEVYWDTWKNRIGLLNRYKTPKGKLELIVQLCRDMMKVIQNAIHRYPSADEFLPCFIYTLVQANPDALVCNVKYITEFRNVAKQRGEYGYYLTHFASAVAFLQQMNQQSFNISAEMYHNRMGLMVHSNYSCPSIHQVWENIRHRSHDNPWTENLRNIIES